MILHILLGLSAVAHATSFYIKPFSKFVNEANYSARGTTQNVHVENGVSNDGKKIIYTYAHFEIQEVFKGDLPSSIEVRILGGTKDGYSLEIPGSAVLKDGENTILFLNGPKSDGSYEIQSLELGKYSIQEKDGKEYIKGGIFNYAKHDDHNLADTYPENERPWTLQDLRDTIKKEGGKLAPPMPDPTIGPSPAPGSPSPTPVEIHAPPIGEPETPVWVYVAGCLVAGFAILIFFFRKR